MTDLKNDFIIRDTHILEEYEKLQTEYIYLFDEFLDLEKINGEFSILKQFYYDIKNNSYFLVKFDVYKNQITDICSQEWAKPTEKLKIAKEKITLKNKLKKF